MSYTRISDHMRDLQGAVIDFGPRTGLYTFCSKYTKSVTAYTRAVIKDTKKNFKIDFVMTQHPTGYQPNRANTQFTVIGLGLFVPSVNSEPYAVLELLSDLGAVVIYFNDLPFVGYRDYNPPFTVTCR